MIIDSSYFEKGELYIPNNRDLSAQPVGSPSTKSDVDFFINKYEPELLLNALGVTLYNELETANSDLPNAAQKWKDLVNGVDYTIDGVTRRWDGLIGAGKQSLIAYFVYCQYLRDKEATFTTTGVVQNDANNAENYDPTRKYIKAWNSFLKQYQGGLNRAPRIIYNSSGSVGLDYYGNKSKTVSLYQYLADQNTLDDTAFPDFEFTLYESYNSFGI